MQFNQYVSGNTNHKEAHRIHYKSSEIHIYFEHTILTPCEPTNTKHQKEIKYYKLIQPCVTTV